LVETNMMFFGKEKARQDGMVYSTRTNLKAKLVSSHSVMSLPEQNELESLRHLDPQAIGAIYDRYFSEVYRFVRYRLNDEHMAEDIASDVFVRLLEAVKTGRGPQTNLKAWLLATASHIVTDHLRKAYRRPESELPETMPDGTPDLSNDYEKLEREQHLKNAMTTLTDEQQYVVTLRFNQGYSLEETAVLMNKNANAVKQLQFRALAALNRALGDMP
jgi:RNA polymerase sigma-70 factor, ECF subfamily